MKKVLISMIILAVGVCAKAQSLTATLQQGDVITPYYGADAFVDAYKAAEDGANITLSPGSFNLPWYSRIQKSITIIGSGAYGSDEAKTFLEGLHLESSNIRVEGVYVTTELTVDNTSANSKIAHCYLNGFNSGGNTSNTIVDQCTISDLNSDDGTNTCIKNCIIKEYKYGNKNSVATFLNCLIYKGPYMLYSHNDIFRNCVIGLNESEWQLKSPGEYYNNVFFYFDNDATHKDELLNITYGVGCVHEGNTIDTYQNLLGGTLDLSAFPTTTAKGDDNTKVGPEGGSGFKLYPAIPRITSKTIDRQTNAQGQINVSITVQAEE